MFKKANSPSLEQYTLYQRGVAELSILYGLLSRVKTKSLADEL